MEEMIISNNSDVLNFLEDVQETVNINNVRNALEAVSNAVSDLTANVHLGESIFTDISLSVISLLNVFDYVDEYNAAKRMGNESDKNAAFGQITAQFMDILGTAIGYVPCCKYTSLVLYVASDCLENGINIITGYTNKINKLIYEIEGGDPKYYDLKQQLLASGASKEEVKALIDSLRSLETALLSSGVDTSNLKDGIANPLSSTLEIFVFRVSTLRGLYHFVSGFCVLFFGCRAAC